MNSPRDVCAINSFIVVAHRHWLIAVVYSQMVYSLTIRQSQQGAICWPWHLVRKAPNLLLCCDLFGLLLPHPPNIVFLWLESTLVCFGWHRNDDETSIELRRNELRQGNSYPGCYQASKGPTSVLPICSHWGGNQLASCSLSKACSEWQSRFMAGMQACAKCPTPRPPRAELLCTCQALRCAPQGIAR